MRAGLQKRVRLSFFYLTALLLELGLQATRHKRRVSYWNIADLDAVGFGLMLCHWVDSNNE